MTPARAARRSPSTTAQDPVNRALTTSFSQGAWVHYTINVPAGGSVSITATRTAGANAVISGIFLGPAGPPASGPGPTPTPTPTPTGSPTPTPTPTPTGPPPPIEQPGKQGDWVGSYGSAGYALAAWNGSTDLSVLPNATLTMLQGNRYLFGVSTEARALENPTESERRQGVYWDDAQIRLRLDFAAAYSGPLDVYAVDVDSSVRRQTVSVDDGSGAVTRALTTGFGLGAWLHYSVNVAAGGSISIMATRTSGSNAVISGLFLGPAGPPATTGPNPTPTPTPTGPPPPVDQPGVQGDWVGNYGSAGYVLGAWNGTSDLTVLPNATMALLQGDRYLFGTIGELRSLENATQTERRQAVLWDDAQVRLRLDFPAGFSGPLDLYAADYDSSARRRDGDRRRRLRTRQPGAHHLIQSGRRGPLHDQRPGRRLGVDHGHPDRWRECRDLRHLPGSGRPTGQRPRPDAHPDPDTDRQPDTHAHTDARADAHADTHADTDTHADPDPDADADPDTHADADARRRPRPRHPPRPRPRPRLRRPRPRRLRLRRRRRPRLSTSPACRATGSAYMARAATWRRPGTTRRTWCH